MSKVKQQPIAETKIPIRPLHECIYLENYRFYECSVKTCKNWSAEVKTRCLGIDRINPIGNKHISDSEILIYKLKDTNVQLRMVSLRRKEAVDSIKCMYILDKFIGWIVDNGEPIKGYQPKPSMLECEKRYPLKVKLLKFESWMWYYMTELVYTEFTNRVGGETVDYSMKDLLDLSAPQYKHVYGESD